MNKYVILTLMFLALGVIGAPAEEAAAPPADPAPALLEGERGPYLMGALTRGRWEDFATELRAETSAYEPNPDLIEALGSFGGEVHVVCVLGTWCSDSRREVPRFWKVLDAAGLDDLSVELIAVGPSADPAAADWEAEQGWTPGVREHYGVELVPTFIVYEGDVELGRIIETPELSIEADLAGILGVNASPSRH